MWNTSAPGNRPVVLLVEDDPDLRDMTGQMLETRGYAVLSAAHAAEAVMVCRMHQGHIDLLLTDLGLPGVSGGELTRSVLAERPDTRVLTFSGLPHHVAVARGLIRTDAPFLSKPFTGDQLAAAVSALLSRHRASVPPGR